MAKKTRNQRDNVIIRIRFGKPKRGARPADEESWREAITQACVKYATFHARVRGRDLSLSELVSRELERCFGPGGIRKHTKDAPELPSDWDGDGRLFQLYQELESEVRELVNELPFPGGNVRAIGEGGR